MAGEKDKAKQIERSVPRVDAEEKISGKAQYIADLKLEGMLHAKTLRSTRSRAKITSIDIPNLPEGYFIVDKNDVPGQNRVKMIENDWPFFAEDEVNFYGEPILLVVGPERGEIGKILSSITVHYEDMEPVLTMEEAEEKGDCYFAEYSFSNGDPEKAFKEAYRIIEDSYSTGYQEHAYLEPQGMIGVYENGKITVYGSLQCPYYVKPALVQGFGWEDDRIRVVQTTTGGGFGGKEEYPSVIAGHAAFAAYKTGKPVKLIYDRKEDIETTTKRHPSVIRFRTALDRDNRITGMEVDIRLNAGAYTGLSNVVLQRAMFCCTGVYNIPDVRVMGKTIATNTVPCGALRGFGAPQAIFAIEMHIHNLAAMLGENPVEYKIKHLAGRGDRTVTGGFYREEIKLEEMLEKALDMGGYGDVSVFGSHLNQGGNEKYRGFGVSFFLHGGGFTGSGERDVIKGKVALKRRKDGKVEIMVSSVEMGQGPQTTLRKIVASTLGLPMTEILYENPDTDRVPDSGPTVASRTAMVVGFLLQGAAEELKNRWEEEDEIDVVKEYHHPDYVKWDQDAFRGDAYPAYSWGVNIAEVELDSLTYQVNVKGVWGVYDVGRPIDELIVRGQMEGGIVQGLGYAVTENLEIADGRVLQNSLTDYIIPTSRDVPGLLKVDFVDNPYEYGPGGAKGAGEIPHDGIAPAVAAAVQNALGFPIKKIPITPEYLKEVAENAFTIRS